MKELPDFSTARVLVVGDVMLDRYWHGRTARISPEAPVPVVQVDNEEGRPGGAANVAVNIAALGGQVTLLGVVGDDEAGRTLERRLGDSRVACVFERSGELPTITKLRVISRHQQLIRLDFEDGFPAEVAAALTRRFDAMVADHPVVVLSDYGKGTLKEAAALIDRARAAGSRVLVDPKGSDFTRYRQADLVTPNLLEFEAVVGACSDATEIEVRGQQLIRELGLGALLVTRGEHGMSLLCDGGDPYHLPTEAQDVFDVTGAGDTVIAALATALAAGQPLETATWLANLAAGVVVGKLGTATAAVAELEAALAAQRPLQRGVLAEPELHAAVAAARARGQSIVMTNGCFDILHAGHVTYLEQAARLGDRLLVAVNIDATVRALKGADRPVNRLEDRMRVLAALGCVDWVVPFSEETPERLICQILPDLLVKGGDNDPDAIPGARCVRDAGGDVRVLTYVDGISTTEIVASIRDPR